MADVTPEPIMKVAFGYMAAEYLFVANEITEKEMCRDRSGNGLFLGWHFKAR